MNTERGQITEQSFSRGGKGGSRARAKDKEAAVFLMGRRGGVQTRY